MSGANDGAIHLRKPKRRVSFNRGDFEKEKVERVEMEAPYSKTEGLRSLCREDEISRFHLQIHMGVS